jgi:hypothetical protein
MLSRSPYRTSAHPRNEQRTGDGYRSAFTEETDEASRAVSSQKLYGGPV